MNLHNQIDRGKIIKGQESENHPIVEKIFQEGQEHVFRWWEELSESSQQRLLDQLQQIDFTLIKMLKEKYVDQKQSVSVHEHVEPTDVISVPTLPREIESANKAKQMGEEIIRSGKLGILLVAGGQGTRLGFEKAKGFFPVSPIKGKSLFQLHAEKILAASRFYGVSLPWYIMTSETNDDETKHFFHQKEFFGFDKKDVFFIKQRMIPALDDEGRFILDAKDHIFTNPDGHGGTFLALMENSAIENMKNRGIEIISYFQVDNVLIKMVDPLFVGYHVQANSEMSSKMVRKQNPREKVGHFVRINGKLRVIEYSEMCESDKMLRNCSGRLKYEAGNIAIHLINIGFVEKLMQEDLSLPYHMAEKKIPYLDHKGNVIKPQKTNGYKFEKFIFDALKYAKNSIIMEILREDEFSPIKNETGENSPETAQRDLSNLFGRWLELAGIHVPKNKQGDIDGLIEISPLYAFNEDQFLEKIDRNLRFDASLYLGSP